MTHVLDSQYHSDERVKLFSNLKSTTERIVSQHSTDILYVHGGITSLVNSFDRIFHHGFKSQLKIHKGNVTYVKDYWPFVATLQWLNPSFATFIESLNKSETPDSTHRACDKFRSTTSYQSRRSIKSRGQKWLEKSIKLRNLLTQIKCLLADESLLSQYYHGWAFLCDEKFIAATLICLSALELNSATVLADVPVDLFAKLEGSGAGGKYVRLHSGTSTTEDPVSSDVEPSPGNKPTLENISTSADPLCGSFQPAKVFPLHRTNHDATSKLCLTSDDLRLPDNDMGSVSSVPMCLGVCSSNLDLIADNNSATFQLLQSDNNLPFYSKPLFNDDSSDNEFNDDLGFLVAMTSASRMSTDTTHSYHESDKSFFQPVQFPQTSCKQSYSALPDVVASAEESFLSQPITKHHSVHLSNQDQQFDGVSLLRSSEISQLNNNSTFSSKSDNSFEQISDSMRAHRRSKSDHTKRQKHFVTNEPAQNLSLNSSSSFPSLSDIDGENQEYRSENTQKTKSLMEFLKNQDLTTCADIDKENAHFHFSEMLIGAIEQVKCQVKVKTAKNPNEQFPTNKLEFLINADFGQPPTCVMPVDTRTTSSYVTAPSCGYSSPFGSISSDAGLPHSVSSSDLTLLPNTPLSTSDSGLSSPPSCDSSLPHFNALNKLTRMDSFRTAESIAIGLLKTFSGQRRVTASEVNWLISEDDVPQKLLPLPSSTAIDPDVATSSDVSLDSSVRIRGNQDWAPPRPQIIFHAPVKLKLKVAMVKQNYRCAGCGTLVNKAYMKRFKYCEYVGKYFCSCCHDNKVSVIPANILHKFDFTRYKVSNFSYDLIERISSDPLFNLNDINSNIYKKTLRTQLVPLYKYIQACRFATSTAGDSADESKPLTATVEQQISSLVPTYMLDGDAHVYSLDGLINVKTGSMLQDVREAVSMATNHLNQCELCQMKGFICEYCKVIRPVIFPHQQNTSSCPACHSCYHTKCYKPHNCPKCKRISKRKELLRRKEFA